MFFLILLVCLAILWFEYRHGFFAHDEVIMGGYSFSRWDLEPWVILPGHLRLKFRSCFWVLFQVVLNILIFLIKESVLLLASIMPEIFFFGPVEIWRPVLFRQMMHIMVRMLSLFRDDMLSLMVFIINQFVVLALHWDHMVREI